MLIHNILRVMIILLLGMSCRSTRITAADKEDRKSSVKKDVKTGESVDVSTESDECITDKSVMADSVGKETVTTKWSVPDVNGRQYPVETKSEKEIRLKRTNSDIRSATRSESGMTAGRNTEDNSKIEELLKSQRKSDNKSEDESHKWSVYGILASVAGVFIWGIVIMWRLKRKKPPNV